ncbi:MAG: TlpA family protein disulfide reductase [Gammaproteobacteria bacterium]|nr:TlpA family protein disulfide reductase [Gammaproteobacteria bacterium]
MLSLILFVGMIASPAQAFLMQNLAAERINLHEYLGDGRWTLVMFWSLDCVPCEAQKPMIESFYQAHKQSRANVIGIALDGPKYQKQIQARIDKNKTTYTNFVAFDDVIYKQFVEEVGKPYHATPTYVMYDPNGNLVGMHTGPIERAALDSVVRQ